MCVYDYIYILLWAVMSLGVFLRVKLIFRQFWNPEEVYFHEIHVVNFFVRFHGNGGHLGFFMKMTLRGRNCCFCIPQIHFLNTYPLNMDIEVSSNFIGYHVDSAGCLATMCLFRKLRFPINVINFKKSCLMIKQLKSLSFKV